MSTNSRVTIHYMSMIMDIILYLIPPVGRNGEMGGTADEEMGVGGVELEPSPPDIVLKLPQRTWCISESNKKK